MFKMRFAIFGAAAALALGTASAFAMQTGTGTERDAHGDATAVVAHTDNADSGDAHGDAVSATASAEGQENRDGAQSDRVHACKAALVKDESSEKQPAKGDKAAKAADRKEDKAEHKTFVACVTGGAAGATS